MTKADSTTTMRAFEDMSPDERRQHLLQEHHFGLLADDPVDDQDTVEDHADDHASDTPPDHTHQEPTRCQAGSHQPRSR
jgi:hypothetical protein